MEMKLHNGFWWPSTDKECHTVVPGQVKDLQRAIRHCRDFEVAIQAGGNVGVWPIELSTHFDDVVSFEACKYNFRCLEKNLQEYKGSHNIAAFNKSLGYRERKVSITRDMKNVGAHQIDEVEGDIDETTIDDFVRSLKLSGKSATCNLLVLDIEGYEPLALRGARDTIAIHKPVLMIEDKGLSLKYGYPKGWTEGIDGYQVVDTIHRDVILVHKDHLAEGMGE